MNLNQCFFAIKTSKNVWKRKNVAGIKQRRTYLHLRGERWSWWGGWSSRAVGRWWGRRSGRTGQRTTETMDTRRQSRQWLSAWRSKSGTDFPAAAAAAAAATTDDDAGDSSAGLRSCYHIARRSLEGPGCSGLRPMPTWWNKIRADAPHPVPPLPTSDQPKVPQGPVDGWDSSGWTAAVWLCRSVACPRRRDFEEPCLSTDAAASACWAPKAACASGSLV